MRQGGRNKGSGYKTHAVDNTERTRLFPHIKDTRGAHRQQHADSHGGQLGHGCES
jgi:hypothetical protein